MHFPVFFKQTSMVFVQEKKKGLFPTCISQKISFYLLVSVYLLVICSLRSMVLSVIWHQKVHFAYQIHYYMEFVDAACQESY